MNADHPSLDASVSPQDATAKWDGCMALSNATFGVAPGTLTCIAGPYGARIGDLSNAIAGLLPVHREMGST